MREEIQAFENFQIGHHLEKFPSSLHIDPLQKGVAIYAAAILEYSLAMIKWRQTHKKLFYQVISTL